MLTKLTSEQQTYRTKGITLSKRYGVVRRVNCYILILNWFTSSSINTSDSVATSSYHHYYNTKQNEEGYSLRGFTVQFGRPNNGFNCLCEQMDKIIFHHVQLKKKPSSWNKCSIFFECIYIHLNHCVNLKPELRNSHMWHWLRVTPLPTCTVVNQDSQGK